MYFYTNLIFFNISNFKIIYKKKITMDSKYNNLVQLNKNELLLNEGNYLEIFDINKFKTKLTIKCENISEFILKMNDGTIIQSGIYGIKRYLLKTMEELPILLKFNNDVLGRKVYNPSDKIVYLYKLKDGRIIICYKNGKIEICNLKFI